ncbi:uncharacterized protein LOC134183036 [Corticium candelabrum]|uniref:uncharacterized protein LOC134183036 n=1 Tax=Corticium candelabrum TaxID=121492 RepID=UPI002E2570A6|nr:uncharacterized protein LOC134183036 [Corticium candelabrum]
MEDNGYLDPLNEDHLFALHHAYLPRIRRCLSEFKSAWNAHPLRTEHNWTPRQIWVNGVVHHERAHQTAVSDIPNAAQDDIAQFGIDPDGPITRDEEDSSSVVTVPQIVPSRDDYHRLMLSVDPLSPSDEFGIDLYLQTTNVLLDINES